MNDRTVTVLGGTGFLGRRLVRHLREAGVSVRIASRHPDRAAALFGTDPGSHPIPCDVNDERSVADAVASVHGVVNAISLYLERGNQTFRTVHVEAAGRVAKQARQAEVARLVHVSGIGADPASGSPYIRSRGEGEIAVRSAFPSATIVRPAVMFGPGDAFLTIIVTLLRRLPAYPLFGWGRTKLQPAYVDDVADAIARVVLSSETGPLYELGGPHIYAYTELLRAVAKQAGARPALVPVPFPLWRFLAYGAEMLPSPLVTRTQVQLLEEDNVASKNAPGFSDLGILPRAMEHVLPQILSKPM